MQNEISPENAVKRAFWTVKVPSMVVLIGPLVIFVVLTKLRILPDKGYEGMKWFIPTFVISLVGSWLVWSIQVPRWRLWAYRRVKNIALLKQIAVESGIIWNAGSIFEKTEIMTQKVRKELIRLETTSASAFSDTQQS